MTGGLKFASSVALGGNLLNHMCTRVILPPYCIKQLGAYVNEM